MYDREINGQELTFGVSGKLIRNVLVMYDRQTESYWSQLLGEAVEGDLVGTKLSFAPSWMMTWEEWKGQYPDTVALAKNGRRGGRDSYTGYYNSDSPGVIGETIFDDRLYTKEFVAGVELDNAVIAYPYSILNEEPLLNHTVDDNEILVVFDQDAAVSIVYDRQLSGQTLTFTPTGESFRMVDKETGSLWDSFTGEAIDGELRGQQLNRLKSTASFWFGWKDIHPDTLVYGIDA